MSVKRYDFDCYAFYDSARLSVNECDDGDYVLHSGYAILESKFKIACAQNRALLEQRNSILSRHNALKEVVKWERECDEFLKIKTYSFFTAWEHLKAASAEVDRLIGEGEG